MRHQLWTSYFGPGSNCYLSTGCVLVQFQYNAGHILICVQNSSLKWLNPKFLSAVAYCMVLRIILDYNIGKKVGKKWRLQRRPYQDVVARVAGLYLVPSTSWFKLNDGNYLPRECRLYNLSTRMSRILVSFRPPWTVEEGDMASFVVQDLRALAPAAKTCPHRPQVFKNVNNGLALP